MANDALEKVRKSLRESLTPKQRRGLMHDRFVLLKRERDLTDKERFNLDGWCQNYPELGLAYRLKEDFYALYDATDPTDAGIRFETWKQSITPEVRDAFGDLVRAWTNWEPWITNYFHHPVTNAYTECLNSLIRVLSRLGRGYSFEALRAKILFTESSHKHTLTRPKFERNAAEKPLKQSNKTIKRFTLDNDILGYGTGVGEPAPEPYRERSDSVLHREPPGAKNYGADISTLIALIEAGKL